jgi:hypothetical protein
MMPNWYFAPAPRPTPNTGVPRRSVNQGLCLMRYGRTDGRAWSVQQCETRMWYLMETPTSHPSAEAEQDSLPTTAGLGAHPRWLCRHYATAAERWANSLARERNGWVR